MKRGESGLSLVLAVDKPVGMSSHDVVNRCRRIFGEKRVGHTGTLDPLASGVLPVCVGPATRLADHLTAHDKHYTVSIAFGAATDTDDCEGAVIERAPIPVRLSDERYAASIVESLVGRVQQTPPAYSAIKVGGRKACDEARKGRALELAPREVEIYAARLIAVHAGGGQDGEGCSAASLSWDVSLHVSKGTYVRAIARDLGILLGCPAHVSALRRSSAGRIALSDCVSLEELETLGTAAALDPVRTLGLRFAFVGAGEGGAVANGGSLPEDALALCEALPPSAETACACTSAVRRSGHAPHPGELVSVVCENRLVALYEYAADARRYRARSVFPGGVSRGSIAQI